jgi:hypothetical protein
VNSQIQPEWIEAATREYITARRDIHPEMANVVEKINALPLYMDWVGGVALRSDGDLIGFLWDEPESVKVETDPWFRFLARVAGANRYPELASLLPQRTDRDRDCPLCKGAGEAAGLREHGIDPKVIRCYCGGAGWLPSNVPDPPGS